MLPRINSRAGRVAHLLCHVELLTTLFHRVCSPAVQSASATGIDANARKSQVSTFCVLVRTVLKWLLLETNVDISTRQSAAPSSPTENDLRLFRAAEILTSSSSSSSSGVETPKVFITSICVPSALRCIDQSIVKISPEHQEKLMQLVVQQVKAIVSQIPLALAHVAVTDAVLCRVQVLASQLDLLYQNKECKKYTEPALEAVAALASYVRSSEFSGRGAIIAEEDAVGIWLADAQRLSRFFEGFSVRVSLLADLGLQNSDCPGLTAAPPYSVVVGSSGGSKSSVASTMTSPGSSVNSIPSVNGAGAAPPAVVAASNELHDFMSRHQKQLKAVADLNNALPEYGQAFVFPSQHENQQQQQESKRRNSASLLDDDTLLSGPAPFVVESIFPSTQHHHHTAVTVAGISAADIERISFDAFKILSCLVQAKQQRSQQPSTRATSATFFSYDAFRKFLSTDLVLMRPMAMHLKKAYAARSSDDDPRREHTKPVAASSGALAAKPAQQEPVVAAAPLQEEPPQRCVTQQSGDFLLALMDD